MNAEKTFEKIRARFNLPFKIRLVAAGCGEAMLKHEYAHADFDEAMSTICLHSAEGPHLEAILAHEFGHLRGEKEGQHINFNSAESYAADGMFGEYWADKCAVEAGYGAALLAFYIQDANNFKAYLNGIKNKLDARILAFAPELLEPCAHWAALGEHNAADKILELLPADVVKLLKPHCAALLNPKSYQSPDNFLNTYLAFTQKLREAAVQGVSAAGQPFGGA